MKIKITKKKEQDWGLDAPKSLLTPSKCMRRHSRDCSTYLDVGSVEDRRASGSSPEAGGASSSSPSTCTASQPSCKGRKENISPDLRTCNGTLCALTCRAAGYDFTKTTGETVEILLTDQCERAREPADGPNLVDSPGITPE